MEAMGWLFREKGKKQIGRVTIGSFKVIVAINIH
jgi:hypothetical protein